MNLLKKRPAQSFLSRISKDGRIVIPKLAIAIFKDGKPNLDNHVAEVGLDPLHYCSFLSFGPFPILFLEY